VWTSLAVTVFGRVFSGTSSFFNLSRLILGTAFVDTLGGGLVDVRGAGLVDVCGAGLVDVR